MNDFSTGMSALADSVILYVGDWFNAFRWLLAVLAVAFLLEAGVWAFRSFMTRKG